MKHIQTPLKEEVLNTLRAGDKVLLSGVVYTARDAAHMRLYKCLEENKPLPIDLNGEVIYYVGPTPTKPGSVIGSAGPTTSGRMDKFTPSLLNVGLKGMIGKGLRNASVVQSIIDNRAIYFVASGGAGALLSAKVESSEIIAYEDLGTEAIRKLCVKEMPLIVAIDSYGNNIYEDGPKKYKQNK